MMESAALSSVSATSLTDIAKSAPSAVQEAQRPGFTETVANAFQSAMDTVQAGETAAIAGARGEASIHDTVHAVINAELTVQAVTSIRDKAVQAYQDLIRMPI